MPDPRTVSSASRALGLALASLAAFATAPALAQETVYEDPGASIGLNDVDAVVSLGTTPGNYLIIDHLVNDGVGRDGDGITTLGGHYTIYDWGATHLFTDARYTIANSRQRDGLSGLLGVRTRAMGGILGAYIGGDRWESQIGNEYTQWSAGVEALFCNVDFRANGYFADDDATFLGFDGKGDASTFFTSGNSIFSLDPSRFEEAMPGWDAEIGTIMPFAPWARVYGGWYGFYSDLGEDATGPRGRIEVRLSNEVTAQVMYSSDDVFGESFNVGGEYRFNPKVGNTVLVPQFDLSYRRHAPVRRNWYVATQIIERDTPRALTNPDGSELTFAVIDNSAGGAGDGTFENPFTALPGSVDSADVILVRRGSADYTGNIVLSEGQQLLGEGKPLLFDTNCGQISLADFGFEDTGLANRPTIRGASADPVVTLADNTVVRSLNLIAQPGSAAIGGGGVDDFLIDCVFGSGLDGVSLANAGGVGTIRDSEFDVTGTGIFASASGSLDLRIRDVDARGDGMTGVYGIDVLSAPGSDVDLAIFDTVLRDFTEAGVRTRSNAGDLDVTLRDVVVADTGAGASGDGFEFRGTNGGTTVVSGRDVNASGLDGIGLVVDARSGADIRTNLVDATFSDNAGDGVRIFTRDGTGASTFTGLQATGNDRSGVYLIADDGSDYRLNILRETGAPGTVSGRQSIVAGNGEDNVRVNADNGSTADLTVRDTIATNAGRDAFSLSSTDGSTLTAEITDVMASDAAVDGIDALAGLNSTLQVDVTNVDLADAGNKGFDGSAVGGGLLDADLDTVDVSMAAVDGVMLSAIIDGEIDFDATNVTGTMAGDNGLDVLAASRGTVDADITDSDFSNAGDDAVQIAARGADALASVTLDGVNANNAGADGIDVVADDGGTVQLATSDLIVTGSGENGLDIALTNGSTFNGSLDPTTALFNNQGDGIEYDVSGGSQLALTGNGVNLNGNRERAIDGQVNDAGSLANVSLADSSLDNSGLDGVFLRTGQLVGGATQVVSLSNTTVNGSTQDGVDFVTNNGSSLTLNTTNVEIANSGSQGIEGETLNAGNSTLNMFVTAITGSVDDGMMIVNDNATTTINQSFSTIDGNGGRGMDLTNINTGTLTVDALSTSYSDNLGGSGVFVMTDNGSLSDTCFVDTAANSNADHGYEFLTEGGSTLVVGLDGAVGNDNPNAGLSVLSFSGSSTYIVSQNNLSTFSDNSQTILPGESGANVEINLVNQAVAAVDIAANATGAAGDGISIVFEDVFEGAIQVGDSTLGVANVSGNGGDGIDVSVTSNPLGLPTNLDEQILGVGKLAGTVFEPFVIEANTASTNGGRGIVFTGSNINIAAGTDPRVFMNTASGNMGSGILIDLDDSNIPGDFSVISNMANDNTDGYGIEIDLDSTVVGNLVVKDNVTMGNDFGGLVITAANGSTVGESTIMGNIADENGMAVTLAGGNMLATPGGDGIAVRGSDSSFGELTIMGNRGQMNTGRGLLVDLVDTPVGTLNITDNSIPVNDLLGVNFNVVGNTFQGFGGGGNPFQITNSSAMQAIASLTFDLTPIVLEFDTDDFSGTSFQPVPVPGDTLQTDLITGLVSVNGTAITPGTNPLQDDMGNVLVGGGLPDGSQILDLVFGDFDPGETFAFVSDVDNFPGMQGAIFGDDLIGSTLSITFENGDMIAGSLVALPGVADGSQFVATSGAVGDASGFDSNGQEGILLSAVRSDIGALNVTGNAAFTNGADGIELVITDSAVVTADISDNIVRDNAETGIRIDSPQLNGLPLDVAFSDNEITGNTGLGVELTVDGTNEILIVGEGNLIDENTGGGLSLIASDDSRYTLSLGQDADGNGSLSRNVGAGLALSAMDNSSGSLALGGQLVDGNTGGGVVILAQDESDISMVTISDSSLTTNGTNGLNLTAVELATVRNVVVADTAIDNNLGTGFQVSRAADARLATIDVTGGSISGNNGDGLDLGLSGGNTDILIGGTLDITTTLTDVAIDNNLGNGIDFRTQATVEATLDVNGGTISGNGMSGIRTIANGSSMQTVSVDGTTFDGTGETGMLGTQDNGIQINSQADTVASLSVANATLSNNGNGIQVNATGNTTQTLAITDTTVDENGRGGIVSEDVNGLHGLLVQTADSATFAGSITDSSFDSNVGGNGILLEHTADTVLDLDFLRVSISDNIFDGFRTTFDSTGAYDIAGTDLRVDNNGVHGFDLKNPTDQNSVLFLDGSVDPTLTNGLGATSSFSGNGSSGIFILNQVGGAGTSTNLDFDLRNSAVIGNGDAAINANDNAGVYIINGNDANGTVDFDQQDNVIRSNNGPPVRMVN